MRPSCHQTYGISAELGGGTPPAWDQVSQALAAAHNYWIATARPDGRPHAVPVWGVWLEGMFYFSTDPASRKGRDLAANPWLVVHLESGDDVVILEGIAEEESDPTELTRLADAYEAK